MVKALLVLSSLLFLMSPPLLCVITELRCGRPGYTKNCPLFQRPIIDFAIGENVHYDCKHENCVTEDSLIRQCLQNGSWSGRIPICYVPMEFASIKKVLAHTGNRKVEINWSDLVDNDRTTCKTFGDSINIIDINLQDLTNISRIIMVFSPNRINNETKIWTGRKDRNRGTLTRRNCTSHVVDINSSLFFTCYGDASTIRIEKTGDSRICEIIVDTKPDECLIPDMPYKARGSKTSSNPYSTYQFRCDENYELIGDGVVTCLPDGSWTRSSAMCRRKNCTSKLPDIANGSLKITTTSVNSIMWLECREGFKPVSDNHSSCLPTGQWTSLNRLECEVIQCDPRPNIPHGKGFLLDGTAYYGFRLQITCDKGYVPTESILRSCQQDGNWENLDICSSIVCNSLHNELIDGGQWVTLSETPSIRFLICHSGYHIEGSPAISQCLINGSWSHTTAICVEIPKTDSWIYAWTPSSVLLIGVAVGAGTAICILCLVLCFYAIKKRRQSKINSSVFHVGLTDSVIFRDEEKERFKANTYEDVIDLRPNLTGAKPRKPSSALPHLPVDADPVYSQPFETLSTNKMTVVNTTGDIYAGHIYAEPVDSQAPDIYNNVSEAWLNEAKLFGRKMSLPGRSSLRESCTPKTTPSNVAICRPVCHSSNIISYKTLNKVGKKPQIDSIDKESKKRNPIYLVNDVKSIPAGYPLQQFQMIENDIYQDDYTSNV